MAGTGRKSEDVAGQLLQHAPPQQEPAASSAFVISRFLSSEMGLRVCTGAFSGDVFMISMLIISREAGVGSTIRPPGTSPRAPTIPTSRVGTMDDQARDDKTMNDKNDTDDVDMTAEEKRRDQLLAAPDAVETDAAPRIEVSKHDGNTRIDIADDAPVRPGPAPEDD